MENKICLLIDGENISSQYVNIIFSELAKYGDITFKRVYGMEENKCFKEWKKICYHHGLTINSLPNTSNLKNGCDIALVIDAMDILHRNIDQIFCIVSSDSDFTRLATRLTEEGVTVLGMGESKTPLAFKESCKKFYALDSLLNAQKEETKSEESGNSKTSTSSSNSRSLKKNSRSNKKEDDTGDGEKSLSEVFELIKHIYETNCSDDGFLNISVLGGTLQKLYPSFDTRYYGYKKLADFVESFKYFELISSQSNENVAGPKIIYIRKK